LNGISRVTARQSNLELMKAVFTLGGMAEPTHTVLHGQTRHTRTARVLGIREGCLFYIDI
jgi:hypothetical protein